MTLQETRELCIFLLTLPTTTLQFGCYSCFEAHRVRRYLWSYDRSEDSCSRLGIQSEHHSRYFHWRLSVHRKHTFAIKGKLNSLWFPEFTFLSSHITSLIFCWTLNMIFTVSCQKYFSLHLSVWLIWLEKANVGHSYCSGVCWNRYKFMTFSWRGTGKQKTWGGDRTSRARLSSFGAEM